VPYKIHLVDVCVCRCVCVSLCVCPPHDNLKTIAGIRFPLGRVMWTSSHVKVIFLKVQEVYDSLLWIADSDIPSAMASSSNLAK